MSHTGLQFRESVDQMVDRAIQVMVLDEGIANAIKPCTSVLQVTFQAGAVAQVAKDPWPRGEGWSVSRDRSGRGFVDVKTSSVRTGTCIPAGVLPFARRWSCSSGWADILCSLYFCW